jgi:two-component system sensor histidine kinase UhpB
MDREQGSRSGVTVRFDDNRPSTASRAEPQHWGQPHRGEDHAGYAAKLLAAADAQADRAPHPVREQLHQVQETTRNSLDEIRRIARRLRPGVLEELGLISALKALATEFSTTGLTVHRSLNNDLPDLGTETELVLYRVAQESLTNAARHAHARHVHLTLRRCHNGAELCIGDDGRGLRRAPEGAGIRGMRERALLIGADLTLGPRPDGGTEVRLRVPTQSGRR